MRKVEMFKNGMYHKPNTAQRMRKKEKLMIFGSLLYTNMVFKISRL